MDFIQLKTKEGEFLSILSNLDKENILPDLLLHKEILKPGCRSSRSHSHSKKQECIYVLEGELSFIEGSKTEVLQRSSIKKIPPGGKEGHYFYNHSAKDAEYISIATKFKEDRVRFYD